jgi:hypothetical protein
VGKRKKKKTPRNKALVIFCLYQAFVVHAPIPYMIISKQTQPLASYIYNYEYGIVYFSLRHFAKLQ